MKRIGFLFIIVVFLSCDSLEKRKLSSEDIYKEEMQTFNWNEVDFYPTFTSCNSIIDKDESLTCFQKVLLDEVNGYLSAQKLVVTEDVSDTIILKLIIDNRGELTISDIKIKPNTVIQIPQIDSLLRQSLKQLPKINPARKRGQEVTTVFELPVIVNIN